MGNLKYAVTEYTRIKDNGNVLVLSLAPTTLESDVSVGGYIVTEEMINKNLVSDLSLDSEIIDYPYWDQKFNLMVANFNVFLRGKKYTEFDAELFIYTLFLDVAFEGEKQFDYVAKVCSIPTELVKLITLDLGEEFKEGKHYIIELFENTRDMLEVSKDYVPLRNR